MKSETLWNRNYILVFVGIIFIFSNFYMLLSTMPLALEKEMNLDASMKSWIVSIYSLGVVLMRPFSGFISDKIGKKNIAFWGFLAFALCTVMYFGKGSIALLLLIRMVHGATHALSTTAHSAMAVDYSPSSMKGQGIGYYGLAMCLAMVIAPAFALYIYDNYDYNTLLWVSTVVAFIGTGITFFVKDSSKEKSQPKAGFSVGNLLEKAAIPISICAAMIAICYSGIIAFIAFYLKDKGIANGAIYFYIAFAASIVLSRPKIGKLIDQKGANYLVYPALILFALAMFLLAMASNLSIVLISGALLGLAYGAVFPSFQTMAIKACAAEKSSTAVGTFFLFYDLGFGVGAIILNKIVAISNYSTMYLFISAFVIVIMLMYRFIMAASRKKTQCII